MSRWFIKNKKPKIDFDYSKIGLNKIEYQILLNRDINTHEKAIEFLSPDKKFFHSPILMKDMVKTGNIMSKVLKDKQKVRIVGDYDVDGVMSTTILMKGLSNLGFMVDYTIPNRIDDGYGLNEEIVTQAFKDGIKVIITCDNGVSAHIPIEEARKLGITTIVTDHHEIPSLETDDGLKENLPNADAIINPKQKHCKYPFKNLCGGAVAYKLIDHLYTIFGRLEDFDDEIIGMAAIATICDVMPLIGENRSLVSEGLRILNNGNNIGLNQLKEKCNIKGDLTEFHFGYIIGPTINSSGRLRSATMAVDLFLTNNLHKAKEISAYLRELNSIRQKMTNEGILKIEEQLKNPVESRQNLLLLRDDSIHESIAGIIAGRVKSKYNKPTIIMTSSSEGLKGSGRSIEGFNIIKEISKYSELLNGFGGHTMACGLSLDKDKFILFKEKLLEGAEISEEDLLPTIRIDASLPLSEISINFIQRINSFAPFGNGNEEPLFGTKNVKVLNFRLLGKNKNVLSLNLEEKGQQFKGIVFQNAREMFDKIKEEKSINLDIIYSPKINEYMGKTNIQIEIKDYRISKEW